MPVPYDVLKICRALVVNKRGVALGENKGGFDHFVFWFLNTQAQPPCYKKPEKIRPLLYIRLIHCRALAVNKREVALGECFF